MRASAGLFLFLFACGGTPPPTAPASADLDEEAQPAPAEQRVSREDAFKAALVRFADEGDRDMFHALLSERMKNRIAKSQAEIDASPAKQEQIKSMARKLGMPETTDSLVLRAHMWREGLSADLEQLRTATVEVTETSSGLRATFLGTALEKITVVDEGGALKIDEN